MASLKKNILYSVAYQILVIILPLITAPYISRVLGAEGIGEYSYSQSVAYYFILMAMLGIAQQGNRSIAETHNNKNERSERFINLYTIQVVTHVIAITVYVFYLICMVGSTSVLAWIQLIYIISSLFDISWLFFGMEQFEITVTRNTIIKILTVVLIFIFVKEENDLWKYAVILVVGTLISQIYLWMYIKRYVFWVPPKWNQIKMQIRPILVLFIPVLAYSIYKVMDKIMLGSMADFKQVGYYENAYKINNIPIGLITAVGNVMLPRMTAVISSGKKEAGLHYIKSSFMMINFVAIAMVFGIAGVSANFVNVYYGPGYTPCINLIMCLNWTVFFIAWANIMRTQYLIPKKKDTIYVKSTIIGAVVNLVLNIILIGHFQAMGAAIGTFFAEFTVMFVQMYYLRRELPIWKYIVQSIPYYLVGILMMMVTRIIGEFMKAGILALVIQIFVGATIFFICSFVVAYRR